MKLLLDTKTTPLPSLDLPSDLSVELSRTNPFLTNEGSQSIPFTIPASSGNLVKLGFPERLRPTTRPETKRPAILLDGSAWIKGTLYIESVNMKEGITCTFYTNEGRLYEQLKKYTLQTLPFDKIGTEGQSVDSLISEFESEINGTKTESEMYAFCACVTGLDYNVSKDYIFGCKLVLNDIEYDSGSHVSFIGKKQRTYFDSLGDNAMEITVSAGYGVSPFMKVSYVLKKIFEAAGFSINLNLFSTNASFNRLVLLNNICDVCVKGGGINPSSILPDMDCEEFINAFRKKFGMEFIEDNNTIEIRSWQDVLGMSPDYEIQSIEDKTISYEDEKALLLTLNNLTDGNTADVYTATHNPPDGIEAEEISFSDYTPSIYRSISPYVQQDEHGHRGKPLLYGPILDSYSHVNTELVNNETRKKQEEETKKLDVVFCFALTGIKSDTGDGITHPFIAGSIREYDNVYETQWGQFNMFVNTMENKDNSYWYDYSRNLYETFYKRRDEMLQKANQQIVCRAKIPAHIINSMDISRPKILDGQKVMIERIDYTLGKSELCQITARTLHLMNE